MTIKICKTCYKEKLEIEFSTSEFKKEGGSCRDCKQEYNRQYRKNNENKIKKDKKEYYIDNKKEILNNRKKYYQNNKDSNKEYRKNNKERISLYDKQYRENNRDILIEKGKEYYCQNREKKLKNNEIWRKNHKNGRK